MKISLKSEKRNLFGRKVKRLRKEGKIPANVFGKKIKSEALTVDEKEFVEVYKRAGETQIVDLDGRPVLIANIQIDPVNGNYLHIDFRQVDLTEKINANVPVELEGESPAEKQNLGVVVQQINEVEVEALPSDLPEKIVVDQSILSEVDQAIYVKDLKVGPKVEIKTNLESIVAKVEPPQKEEVVETQPQTEEGTPVSTDLEKPEEKEEAPTSNEAS